MNNHYKFGIFVNVISFLFLIICTSILEFFNITKGKYNIFLALFVFIITIIIHELGHYYTAKKEGIYESFKIFPFTCVILKQQYKKANTVLYGLWFSFLTLPLYYSIGINIYFAICLLVSLAMGDIFMFFVRKYHKI